MVLDVRARAYRLPSVFACLKRLPPELAFFMVRAMCVMISFLTAFSVQVGMFILVESLNHVGITALFGAALARVVVACNSNVVSVPVRFPVPTRRRCLACICPFDTPRTDCSGVAGGHISKPRVLCTQQSAHVDLVRQHRRHRYAQLALLFHSVACSCVSLTVECACTIANLPPSLNRAAMLSVALGYVVVDIVIAISCVATCLKEDNRRSNFGANLSLVASLAGIMFVSILRPRGVQMSAGVFSRMGFSTMPFTICAAMLTLGVESLLMS